MHELYDTYFQLFDYFLNFYLKINAFDAIRDLKREKKKVWQKRRDRTTGRSHKQDNDTRFTICTTGADVSIDSAVLLLVPVPWLTDVSSSQRWVIYSQTNGAVSNYTYSSGLSDLSLCFLTCFLFSNLSLCFLTCYNVFGIVVVFSELFCFLDLHLRL